MGMYYEKVPSDVEAESQPLAGGEGLAAHSTWFRMRLNIILVCMAYAIVGPTLVLINNHILKSLNFPFPLLLSALGLLTTAVCCAFILHVLPRLRRAFRRRAAFAARSSSAVPAVRSVNDDALAESPARPHDGGPPVGTNTVTLKFWMWNMVPIGAAQGLTFASTNAAYMYLTITYTQMLAAFTPTLTLFLLWCSGIEIPTMRASLSVIAIAGGSALSSYGEGNFSAVGLAYRSMGIFSEATRLVLTQKLLKNHKLSIFESQYYLAPVGAAFLLLGAMSGEMQRSRELNALGTIAAHPWLFSASALLGVAASTLTFLVIKLTNSVTLKVINTARNAGFVLFTIVVMGEAASSIQIFGYCISVAAFSSYTYYKIHKL